MLVTMKQQEFNSIDPATLADSCIKPILQQIHTTINPSVRLQIASQLTPGQRALFLFHVLYDHAGGSAGDLYFWVSFLLREPNTWSAIKASSRFFSDAAMLQLLEQIEALLAAKHPQSTTEQPGTFPSDLDNDPELLASLSQLNTAYHQLVPKTLNLIGTFIHNHPDEFVQLEE